MVVLMRFFVLLRLRFGLNKIAVINMSSIDKVTRG